MPLQLPCPTGKKPKDAKLSRVTKSQAFQDWLERNHGRQVEPPPTRLEEAGPGWQRFADGLTRQYEFLPQGGKYQGVRAAVDKILRATRAGEMQQLFNLQDAYNGLSRDQRDKVDLAYTARDMDEEIRTQHQRIEEQERVRFLGRRGKQEAALARQRRVLEDGLRKAKADDAAIAKRLAIFDRRAEARFKRADDALAARIKRRQENAQIMQALQRDGLTPEDVAQALADAAAHEKADPKLKDAIDRDKATEKAIVDRRKAAQRELFGFEPDLNREEYLHHEMLFDAAKNDAAPPGGKKFGAKGILNAFYTTQRKGTSLRYNTNTMEAKHRVYARMIADTVRLEGLAEIKKHDIGPELVERALAEAQASGGLKPGDTLNLDAYIPDTHVRLSPDKGTDLTQFWDAQARYVERLAAANFDRLGLTPGQNKQDLYITHLQDWVIPKEIAETLRAVVKPFDPTHEAHINRMLRGMTSFWKRSRLHWPHAFLKYSIGNFGDDTASAFKFTPVRRHPNLIRLFITRAVPEVVGYLFGKRQPSPEYREFLLRAGTDSTQLAAELGIANLKGTARQRMERALSDPKLWRKVIGGAWQAGHEFSNWYLNGVFRLDGAREHLWRYAMFLDNVDMMTKSADGRPSHYGASIPDEVLAYDNIYDRAYHMSNDTFIAYDKTTAMGRWLADHLFPFWRFQEGNHRRVYRYLANQTRSVPEAAQQGASVAAKLGLAAKATPFALARLGSFAVKMASIEAALTAYNYAMYPEAMDSLDEKERQKPLLITGYDPRTGEVQYIRNLGSIPDFYALFGLMDNARIGKQWLDGEISSWDAAKKVIEKDTETLVGMFGPWRNIVLLAHGVGTTRSGKVIPVRDPVDKLLGEALGPWAQMGYRALNDIPQKKFDAGKMVLGGGDVDEAAYHHTLDRLGDFKRKMELGSEVGGGPYTEKQNALYWHRQAKRYGDTALAAKYGATYAALNGPSSLGYKSMVEAMSPVGKLTLLQIEKWLGTLDVREKRGTLRAMQHWADLFAADFDVKTEITKGLKDPKGADAKVRAEMAATRGALEKSPRLTGDRRSLLKLLDSKETLPEETRKAVDSNLAYLLNDLRWQILLTIHVEGMDKGGMTDTLLTTPGVIEGQIDRGLKKSGVE